MSLIPKYLPNATACNELRCMSPPHLLSGCLSPPRKGKDLTPYYIGRFCRIFRLVEPHRFVLRRTSRRTTPIGTTKDVTAAPSVPSRILRMKKLTQLPSRRVCNEGRHCCAFRPFVYTTKDVNAATFVSLCLGRRTFPPRLLSCRAIPPYGTNGVAAMYCNGPHSPPFVTSRHAAASN